MKPETTVVTVGEYEVSHINGENFLARRHGEPWRNLTGDNLVFALVSRIEQLQNLWLEPTKEMVDSAIGDVQQWLEEHAETQSSRDTVMHHGYIDPELTTDDDASDLAVFIVQSMASKLPKEP